jgi:hypothetical protein
MSSKVLMIEAHAAVLRLNMIIDVDCVDLYPLKASAELYIVQLMLEFRLL